jgi:hypothetical protein
MCACIQGMQAVSSLKIDLVSQNLIKFGTR